MGQTEHLHRITAALPGTLLTMLAGALLLFTACGGDDTSPTGDGTVSPSADGETLTPTPTASTTPGDTAVPPAECTIETNQGRLLGALEFDSEPGVYKPGDEVEMTLKLINCDDDAEQLYYSTTQRYVFIVEQVVALDDDSVGLEVWRSSDGTEYDETKGEEVIAINETVVYTESWDQVDTASDQEVPEGLYRVSAFSVGCAVEDQADCRFGPVRYIEITSGDN